MATWRDLYFSHAQSVYALIVAPALFLLYRALSGRRTGGLLPAAAGFVDRWAIVFAALAFVDPIVTGPLVRALGVADGAVGTAVLLICVLLGDLRVFLLLFALLAIAAGRPGRSALGLSAGWTLVVPVLAYPLNALWRFAMPGLDASSIWLVYETGFTLLALTLRARLLPAVAAPPAVRDYLRAVLGYVAMYYALWVASDVLIQLAHVDAGWALRMLPNQLYYSGFVPFAFFTFFARRSATISASTQASR